MFERDYFDWMVELICDRRLQRGYSYYKLLNYLHDTEFRYSLVRDGDRAHDGIGLRYRFWYESKGYDDDILGTFEDVPCSVLEMMIALAIRCEEDIMDDPSVGNRIGQWFWGMVVSLGLGAMTDDNFDIDFVDYTIERFLNRQYEPNGKGGLFTIRHADHDLRSVEIWFQLCWYLDSIV